MTDESRSLSDEVYSTLLIYEEVIGRSATATRNMLEKYGVVETCSRLMASSDLQTGFKRLRDADRLDATFEALVVKHEQCFKKPTVDAARWRLKYANKLLS